MTVIDSTARAILAEGRQLHVGVLTTTGPHVTPELYTYDGEHIWFLTAADTLKARVMRRDPHVAAVVRVGSRSLIVTGDVDEFDLADPMQLLTKSKQAVTALAALLSFTIRNAVDLAAFGRDLAAGRLPSRLPPRRVLLRLAPRRAITLDGAALATTTGNWPGRVDVADQAPALRGEIDCVVGIAGDDGVFVVPGRAEPRLDDATVPAIAVQLADLPTGRAVPGCLVVDAYGSPGPAAKAGTLMRGELCLTVTGAECVVDLTATRETTWDGADTRTTAAR
jgi:hypothetical protein